MGSRRKASRIEASTTEMARLGAALLALVAVSLFDAGARPAAAQIVPIRGKSLTLRDDTSPPLKPESRRIAFRSGSHRGEPSGIVLPPVGTSGDPTAAGSAGGGATLTVYNAARSSEMAVVALPAESWLAQISGAGEIERYRYRDPQRANGPISSLTVDSRGNLRLKGKGASWLYTLDEPAQGAIAVRLELGSGATWCALFPAKTSGNPPSTAKHDSVDEFTGAPNSPPPATCPAVTCATPPSYDFSAVTARMQSAVDAGELPGIGLVIVDRCRTLYEEAVGSNTLDTASLVASASKLTSSTTLMTLVDQGLIQLEDRIDQHLPFFTDAKGAITIRQLLAQTHGLPALHPCIPPPGLENGMTLAECVEAIAAETVPVRPPGTACDYQPAVSYQIMGRIAEVVTGQSWTELWRERVGDPLLMSSSTFGAVMNPRVGGGLSTTIEDYAHLVQMHLRGGEWGGGAILSPWAVAEMRKDHCTEIPFLSSSPAKPEVSYGLSWWIDDSDPSGAAAQLSVAGAFGAIPWLSPGRDYAAFWLTFKNLGASAPVWLDVVPLVHSALDAEGAP